MPKPFRPAQGLPGCAALLLLGPCAVASAETLTREFTVFLDQKRIGTHRFEVESTADGARRVRSSASFDVRILGIRAYSYRHEAAEAWRDGCLRELGARTDDNGSVLAVTARDTGAGLEVAAGVARRQQPGCTWTYAYWDPGLRRQSRLLNPQTGALDPVRFEERGYETLQFAGRQVQAERLRLTSDRLTIDLWYGPDGEWLQLLSTTADGKRLRYQLTAP
jgi:hypothetical protein